MNAPRVEKTLSAPLRYPLFRKVWCAGVLSNLGILIQAVAAAWEMTELTGDTTKVALVQTASSAPMMLFAIAAGAIADIYDRRIITISALSIACCGALILSLVSYLGRAQPWSLLFLCFIVACGTTLYAPAWQSSVRDQVPSQALPAAVALNGLSYNLGRSLGPAIGGLIVASAGVTAAFGLNALTFIPLILVLMSWRRAPAVLAGPREAAGRAILLGVKYVCHAPVIRTVLFRVIMVSIGTGALLALLPLVARRLLNGGPFTYGLLYGCFGSGAVLGALVLPWVRQRLSAEMIARTGALTVGAALVTVGLSPWTWLSALALLPAGMGWTQASSTFNIVIQLSAPRWVAGRALASYQTAIAGGIAIGSWFWGTWAQSIDLAGALVAAGTYLGLLQILCLRMRIPDIQEFEEEATDLFPDPAVKGAISGRDGPITIFITYQVDALDVPKFKSVIEEIKHIRCRNGANGWVIGRNIENNSLWVERFNFATWHDYLSFRNRATLSERRIIARATALHRGGGRPSVVRIWDRPTLDSVLSDEGGTALVASHP